MLVPADSVSTSLPIEGLKVIQRSHRNRQTGMIENVDIEIQTPAGFPEKYLPSLIRTAELCAVKKHIEKPPVFNVFTLPVSSLAVS